MFASKSYIFSSTCSRLVVTWIHIYTQARASVSLEGEGKDHLRPSQAPRQTWRACPAQLPSSCSPLVGFTISDFWNRFKADLTPSLSPWPILSSSPTWMNRLGGKLRRTQPISSRLKVSMYVHSYLCNQIKNLNKCL